MKINLVGCLPKSETWWICSSSPFQRWRGFKPPRQSISYNASVSNQEENVKVIRKINFHPWIRERFCFCLTSIDWWKFILIEVEQWTKRHGKRWKRIRERSDLKISLNDVMTVWQFCLIVIILSNYVITTITHKKKSLAEKKSKWMAVLYC